MKCINEKAALKKRIYGRVHYLALDLLLYIGCGKPHKLLQFPFAFDLATDFERAIFHQLKVI